jgi:phosphoesterase RecJ-like protein
VIVVDTGTWNQIGEFGDFLKSSPIPRLVIDHHRTQDDLGGPRLVDTTAEAAGRLVYEACRSIDAPLTAAMADALFLAIATDTGWFRHSNTTPETFKLAEELTRAGANPNALYDLLYEQNQLGKMRLAGKALDRLEVVANGQVAYTEIYLNDYAETGAAPPDTEDLINFPRGIEGVEVALMFIEQKQAAVKVSFRSRSRVDIDKIAERFGGGGHRLAAGATVPGTVPAVRSQVLAAIEESLRFRG